jgi:hypothetical protein
MFPEDDYGEEELRSIVFLYKMKPL